MNPRVVMQVDGWDSFQAIEPYLTAPIPKVINEAFAELGDNLYPIEMGTACHRTVPKVIDGFGVISSKPIVYGFTEIMVAKLNHVH
jgi:hypothetical protein